MANAHFNGPVISAHGFKDGSGANIVTGADLVAVTATAAEIDVLAAVTPGTAAASKALVLGASKEIETITTATITNLASTAATITTGTLTNVLHSVAAKTAGTTQTQAGATLITSTITLGTTGNADDGYLLPAMVAGRLLIIHNVSANAGKVYGNAAETLNGTAGNAGSTALTASKTMLVFGTGAGTSVSAVMM